MLYKEMDICMDTKEKTSTATRIIIAKTIMDLKIKRLFFIIYTQVILLQNFGNVFLIFMTI